MGACFACFHIGPRTERAPGTAAAHDEAAPALLLTAAPRAPAPLLDAFANFADIEEEHGTATLLDFFGTAASALERSSAPGWCKEPCPCCYYTISSIDETTGGYRTGWRKFGGQWGWWHKNAPHSWRDPGDRSQGVRDPRAPRCKCCYYNQADGAPGCSPNGWYWSHDNYSWQWYGANAPHWAPWDSVEDDARYMKGIQNWYPDYAVATKSLCEYLHKGVTWQRLQVLAATPLVENGLGLFNEGSRGPPPAHLRTVGIVATWQHMDKLEHMD